MLTVAYLANQFPSAVETYVGEEILELRRRGVEVIAGSVRTPERSSTSGPDLCLEPMRFLILLQALSLLARRWAQISDLLVRVLEKGNESLAERFKALLHTWLGAYYAVVLQSRRVDHIHTHHGYFGSWIGMVAARLLKISFSLTLHGSDLLRHGVYLDAKLEHCSFCITISEYNQRYIWQHFPAIDHDKIVLSRLGVDTPKGRPTATISGRRRPFMLLAVGRLHSVKNYAFLIHACARLRDLGLDFECSIAGEGPEHEHLTLLIRGNRLHDRVTLLGHVPHDHLEAHYRRADLFVLTSISEGIPLVLMEAMAHGTIVLAPAITGIPELVIDEQTGFLFTPSGLDDFVRHVLHLEEMMRSGDSHSLERLNGIREAARSHISDHFNRQKNLGDFADKFLESIAPHDWSSHDADPVLQQI